MSKLTDAAKDYPDFIKHDGLNLTLIDDFDHAAIAILKQMIYTFDNDIGKRLYITKLCYLKSTELIVEEIKNKVIDCFKDDVCDNDLIMFYITHSGDVHYTVDVSVYGLSHLVINYIVDDMKEDSFNGREILIRSWNRVLKNTLDKNYSAGYLTRYNLNKFTEIRKYVNKKYYDTGKIREDLIHELELTCSYQHNVSLVEMPACIIVTGYVFNDEIIVIVYNNEVLVYNMPPNVNSSDTDIKSGTMMNFIRKECLCKIQLRKVGSVNEVITSIIKSVSNKDILDRYSASRLGNN